MINRKKRQTADKIHKNSYYHICFLKDNEWQHELMKIWDQNYRMIIIKKKGSQDTRCKATATTAAPPTTHRDTGDQTETNNTDKTHKEKAFKQGRSTSKTAHKHTSRRIFSMLHCNTRLRRRHMHAQSGASHLKKKKNTP